MASPITIPSQEFFDEKITGSIRRTQASKMGDFVSVLDFAANGVSGAAVDPTGVLESALGIQAALNVAGRVYFPPGTYKIGSAITIPTSAVLVGGGKQKTILKRSFTGDLITSQGSYSAIYDLTIDGDTATNGAGRGILIGGGTFQQKHVNVEVINFVSAVLEFAADAGSGFSSFGSTYYTTGAVGSVAAVKVTGVDSAAVPRAFDSITSNGCTLFDFGGCNHFWASKFFTNGLIFPSASAFNVDLSEMRLGGLGGTVSIQGDSHHLSGVSAVAVSSAATSSIIDVQPPSWAYTDTGANCAINQINPSYTPVWTATGTAPALGNGTLVGRYSRRGAWVILQIDFTPGSTSTFGTGTYEFSIPQAAHAASPNQICGIALAQNNAGTASTIGAVRVTNGSSVLRVYFSNAGVPTAFGLNLPFTWDAGSNLRLSCEYRVP